MRNMKKGLFSAALALAMLLSLSVSAFAAEEVSVPQDNHYVTLHVMTEEETQIALASDYTVREGTVLLKKNNSTGTAGTKITSFTAEHETALFTITSATMTETYNVVCLDAEGNEVSEYYADIPLGNSIAAENLIIGEKYTFRVSTNDGPSRCTAYYKLQY